jgi:hypothetical protein
MKNEEIAVRLTRLETQMKILGQGFYLLGGGVIAVMASMIILLFK